MRRGSDRFRFSRKAEVGPSTPLPALLRHEPGAWQQCRVLPRSGTVGGVPASTRAGADRDAQQRRL